MSDAGLPDPAAAGMDSDALRHAVDLAEAWSTRGQLTVLHRGRLALDVAFGCDHDALFWLFSASKPFIAVLVLRLIERGLIGWDDPVARYWPEFAENGKDRITVRQVLQHRTGMPTAGSALGDALAMSNWRQSIGRIERSAPQFDPARGPAYQFLIYGFVLGELVSRVTGDAVEAVLQREVLDPLELRDTFLGLPEEAWPRHVRLHVDGPGGGITQSVLNRRATRAAVIPAAGISSTSRDLARFYQALLRDRAGEGPGILRRETLAEALVPSSDRQTDLFARAPIRWSAGFQLGGPRLGARSGPMGRTSSPTTFGHNGSNCCMGWADPRRELVVAYLTDRVPRQPAGIRQHARVSDAIIAAVRD
ncbi:serine hydrolase domain-containing protein [Lysinimonas soli]|uniref:Serine hydrolase domain-containing protein n=1 Tax=Lysinimonas soli TaxID=1074233 RepID=A0ABW0NNI6_9MICO